MTARKKSRSQALLHVAPIAFACIAWFWASAAAAEPAKKPSPAAPPPSPQAPKSPPVEAAKEAQPGPSVMTFQLNRAKPEELVKLLSRILNTKNVKLGACSINMTVTGPREALEAVREVTSKLDLFEPTGTPQPAGAKEQEPEKIVCVYRLEHADASAVAEALTKTLQGPDVRVAVDKKTNGVVVFASRAIHETARQIIQSLDVPEATRRGDRSRAPCQFRIVWLASGLSSKDTPAPADDLKQVVEQLSGLGVKDVRQVGQVMVNTKAEGMFQVKCSPLFESAPAELSVEGKLDAKTEPVQLSLRIAAKQRRPRATLGLFAPGDAQGRGEGGAIDLVNLDAMISPRFDGSYVVLGVAPVGHVTSVFVVQAIQRPER